jgi:LCP family protein required for cell wall assembly
MRSVASVRRARLKRNIIIFLIVALIAAGGYAYLRYTESRQLVEERGTATENIGTRKRVEYDGHTYAEKTALTSILLMGIDKTDDAVSYGARQGGQADFLLLIVIDHQNKQIWQLQVDRDTMTPVEVLGILGNPVGTRTLQISLSHGFGLTEEACCENTVKAMSNLLEGMAIDYYVSLNLDAMERINNLLGGVTVTLEDDFSDSDPTMVPGATIKLTDEQAAIYLRARMNVGRGTNTERMARQRVYMTAALEAFETRLKESASYAETFFDGLSDGMTTNMKRGTLLGELNQAYNYETLPVSTLEGEHVIGSDGFMQFRVAEGAGINWVMQACYDLLS